MDTYGMQCPWCQWTHRASKAAHVASRWVTHCIWAHDVFPNLDKAEFYVLGDPGVKFDDLQPRQRKPGDERPWHEIRGRVAA